MNNFHNENREPTSLNPNPFYKTGVPTESKSSGPMPQMEAPWSSGGQNRPNPRRMNGVVVIVLVAILAILLAFYAKRDKSVPTATTTPVATTAPVVAPMAPPIQQEEDTFFTASPVSLSGLEMNLHKNDGIVLISSSSYETTDYEGYIHKYCTNILCDSPSSGNYFGYDIGGRYSTLSGSLYGYDDREPVCWLEIYGDGELLCVTDKVSEDNPSTSFKVDVSGVKQLKIVPLCDSYDAFSDTGWLLAEDLVLTP